MSGDNSVRLAVQWTCVLLACALCFSVCFTAFIIWYGMSVHAQDRPVSIPAHEHPSNP